MEIKQMQFVFNGSLTPEVDVCAPNCPMVPMRICHQAKPYTQSR